MRPSTEFWIYKNYPKGPEAWEGPFKKISKAKKVYRLNYSDDEYHRGAPNFVVAEVKCRPVYPKRKP